MAQIFRIPFTTLTCLRFYDDYRDCYFIYFQGWGTNQEMTANSELWLRACPLLLTDWENLCIISQFI